LDHFNPDGKIKEGKKGKEEEENEGTGDNGRKKREIGKDDRS